MKLFLLSYQYQLVLHTFLILPRDFEKGAAVQGVTGVFHDGAPWDVLGGKLLTRAACKALMAAVGEGAVHVPSILHTHKSFRGCRLKLYILSFVLLCCSTAVPLEKMSIDFYYPRSSAG